MKNEKIERKRSIIEDLKTATSLIEIEIDKLIAASIIRTHPEKQDHKIHCPFFWECEKSPFDWCAYDIDEDPTMDSCIYCGEPYKRK